MAPAIADKSRPTALSRPQEPRSAVPSSFPRRLCPVCGVVTEQQAVYEKCGFAILRCRRCRLGRTDVAEDFDPTAIYTAAYLERLSGIGLPVNLFDAMQIVARKPA